MSKRILVVDDETGIRKIIAISLNAIAGWEVLAAASGQEGVAIAQREQLDAILLDVMLAGMDGITTLKRLQANPTTQNIPVILLTAKAEVLEQQQFAKLPIAGVITKPFTAPELAQQMSSLLNWAL